MVKIAPNDIQIRNCTAEDIESIADYLCNCSEEFLKSFGADKKKVPPKEILIENFKKNLDSRGILKNFAIGSYKGQSVGHSNVNNIIENESGVIHGQIWDPALRGIGASSISIIKSCDHFFDEFNFKKIIFKVPHINSPANRAMEKLGFSSLGSVIYEFPLMIEPINCYLYELDRKSLEELKRRFI